MRNREQIRRDTHGARPDRPVRFSRGERRPHHSCLACGSGETRITGRVVDCRSCETRYYLPAVTREVRHD